MMRRKIFFTWIPGLLAALVMHAAAGCGDGGGGQDGDVDAADLAGDEAGDADAEDVLAEDTADVPGDSTDVPGDEPADADQDSTDVHVDGEGDPERECPYMPWECPDWLTEGGMFCDGDDLYSGGIACDPECGCSCLADFMEHCDAGCNEPEDGTAACN
jgi:hypothetical protein